MSALSIVQSASVEALKLNRPGLYAAIEKLVSLGQSPEQIDNFIVDKFHLPKGNVWRDSVYYTAQVLSKGASEEDTPYECPKCHSTDGCDCDWSDL